jgi:hypothetical protein
MQFVQIGKQLINISRVTSIDLDGDPGGWPSPSVLIHFGAGEQSQHIQLFDTEAEAFRVWAKSISCAYADESRRTSITIIG